MTLPSKAVQNGFLSGSKTVGKRMSGRRFSLLLNGANFLLHPIKKMRPLSVIGTTRQMNLPALGLVERSSDAVSSCPIAHCLEGQADPHLNTNSFGVFPVLSPTPCKACSRDDTRALIFSMLFFVSG